MMLAFDTSGPTLSAALFEGKNFLSELESDAGAKHSNVLLPIVQRLLKKCSVSFAELEVLAVCLGPGSFTGLRVGIATAKVLAYASGKKIVGVTSLEAAARAAMDRLPAGKTAVAVVMDARRSMVYGAVYGLQRGQVKTIFKPALLPLEKFMAMTKNAVVVKADGFLPRASHVAEAALPLIARKKFIDPFKLEPLYLHARDCNVTYKKR